MKKEGAYKAHIIFLPFHGQGHMNTMVQFSKRLAAKGAKITVATTLSNSKSMQAANTTITFESIYDDSSEMGMTGPGGFKGFFDRFEANGYNNITQLYKRFQDSENPVKCLIYDGNIPWGSKVAIELGIASGAFFVQNIAFFASTYPTYCDIIGVPMSEHPFSMPGLPEIRCPDIHSLGPQTTPHSPIMRFMLSQFDNIGKSDWVFFNSFDKLEDEAVRWMSKLWPVTTIGPTLPSSYLDNRIEGDNSYGFHIYDPNIDSCIKWLDSKEKGSVVYVSFGSVAKLNKKQSAEVAKALANSGKNFLWVVKPSEEHTLPSNFAEENSNQGLVVQWCPQLVVLAHDAVGCFISHCGWNSTMEIISLGVPVVPMPQFLDQINAGHYAEHIWRVGVQPKLDHTGVVTSDEIGRCIKEVMDGEMADEYRKNAAHWKALAREAIDKGGSSDKHINEVLAKLAV